MDGGDAKKLLNALKVEELKKLCKEEGLKFAGKKAELIERIVAHRSALVGNAQSPEPSARTQSSSSAAAVAAASRSPSVAASSSSDRAPTPASSPSLGRPAPKTRGRPRKAKASPSRGSPRLPPLVCIRCNAQVVPRVSCNQSSASFWCPLCRFKVMDPFNSVVEPHGLLKQGFVTATTLQFDLDLPDLRQWRRDGHGVEVRMVRLSYSKVAQAWPRELQIIIEGHQAVLVKPPEDGHKRRDVPQSIVVGLKPGRNNVTFHAKDDNLQDFVFGIVRTAPQAISELSLQVERCNRKHARLRVCDLLRKDDAGIEGSDEIVCLSRDKLKLVCPITMERVQEPVRGKDCKHLQCFGLSAYLMSNRQMRAFNNRWNCPVCTLVLRPLDLCFDPYVEQVLSSTGAEVEEVTIVSDGSWRCQPSSPVVQRARSSEAVVDDMLLDSQADDMLLDSQDSLLLDLDGANQRRDCIAHPVAVSSADVLDIANVHRHSNHMANAVQIPSAGSGDAIGLDSPPSRVSGRSTASSEAMAVDLDSPIFKAGRITEVAASQATVVEASQDTAVDLNRLPALLAASKASSLHEAPQGTDLNGKAANHKDVAHVGHSDDVARKRVGLQLFFRRPKNSPMKPFPRRAQTGADRDQASTDLGLAAQSPRTDQAQQRSASGAGAPAQSGPGVPAEVSGPFSTKKRAWAAPLLKSYKRVALGACDTSADKSAETTAGPAAPAALDKGGVADPVGNGDSRVRHKVNGSIAPAIDIDIISDSE